MLMSKGDITVEVTMVSLRTKEQEFLFSFTTVKCHISENSSTETTNAELKVPVTDSAQLVRRQSNGIVDNLEMRPPRR